jgi:PleD family two-component response regulator
MNYYYSPILDNDNFYHSHNNNNNNHERYHSESSPLQNQESNTTNIERRNESFNKRILIVDDDTDITFTYKLGLERYYEGYDDNNINNKTRFEVYTNNNPLVALSEFKSNFYDLLLIDINMP